MSLKTVQAVLLPYATPHPSYGEWGAFHPMAMQLSSDRSVTVFNEMVDWTGWGTCDLASRLSHTVIATIPPKTTPAGFTLDYLLSKFVNVNNILAEVERVETDKTSIADQIGITFDSLERLSRLCVVMPYQCWYKKHTPDAPYLATEEASFAFTHQLANVRRLDVPECVVVTHESQNGDGTQMVCKDASSYADLDPMLRGPYTSVLSMFEITRSEYEAFKASPDYPNLGKLLKVKLKGLTGAQALHAHGFI